MKNLEPEICKQLGIARRKAGISQSALALECGCKQSAISMFEQGDGTKLNEEVIEKIANKFGISLEKKEQESKNEVPISTCAPVGVHARGFCPNPHCPSNHLYEVEGRTYFRPQREDADPVYGKFCALCGEVLEKRCPTCGAVVHEGAICSFCGESYVHCV